MPSIASNRSRIVYAPSEFAFRKFDNPLNRLSGHSHRGNYDGQQSPRPFVTKFCTSVSTATIENLVSATLSADIAQLFGRTVRFDKNKRRCQDSCSLLLPVMI
jgi:hypothetical protein